MAGAIIVSMVWLSLGTAVGFATIALPQLQKNTTISSEKNEIRSPIAQIKDSEINNRTNATYHSSDGLYLDEELGSWFAAALLLAGNT